METIGQGASPAVDDSVGSPSSPIPRPMPLSIAFTRTVLAAVAPAALAVLATGAWGQVFKCVDRAGHTTYQQAPCRGGQTGSAIELADPVTGQPGSAVPSDKAEAIWHAAARERRAIVGMPKTFVTQGLGSPAEIRAPRTGEAGSEVWVYRKGAEVMRIGFQDNAVAWMRSDAVAVERPGGTATSASPVDREARVREALTIGKTCTAALQDAGPPDKEEPLSVGQGAGTGMRYLYVFDASNANAYAAFVCLGGRVTSVERYLPGR